MIVIYDSPPPLPPHITLLALNLRFTREERDAIRAAELTDADVSDVMYLMRNSRYIDLERTETINSLYMLETKGLLGPGRAYQILSAPVQAGEIA
jgi:hypothetical protein